VAWLQLNWSLNFSFSDLVPSKILFFDFFVFLIFFFKTDNINVDSTRKINDCEIYALKVERVQNTFEN